MSTTIKRVALVAVAALGLGVLSVVPSNAANQGDQLVLSSATGTQETTDTATAGSATATLSFLASAAGDSMSVTASLTSFPAGNTALPVFDLVETTTGTIAASSVAGAPVNKGALSGLVQYVSAATTGSISAKYKVYINAPTVAGTYVVKLTPAVVAGGGSLNATAQTLTITVTAKASISTVAASATSILNAGETSSATADAVVTADRTASLSTAAATIKVGLKNAAGSAVTAESFTATIAGPGILGSGEDTATTIAGPNATARVIQVKNGDVVQVFPDGTSGVATITIASMLGVTLATETVTFFGAAASIVTTVKKPVLGGTSEVAGVLDIVVKDSAGVVVSNLGGSASVRLVSSDVTKIAGAYTAVTPVWSATTQSYTVPVTPVAAGSANITVTTKASATATTGVDAAAVSVRVGGAAAQLDGLLVATDKTSYAPGELVTLTVTPTDAAGLVLSDETYTVFTSAGIVSSHVLVSPTAGFSLAQAGAQNGGVAGTGTATGVATYNLYAPNMECDMT
jgi:hypothetical protein